MLLAAQAHLGSKNLQVHMEVRFINVHIISYEYNRADCLLAVLVEDSTRRNQCHQHWQDLVCTKTARKFAAQPSWTKNSNTIKGRKSSSQPASS
jgi:hypothetical protein